jgi:hypothetical protein
MLKAERLLLPNMTIILWVGEFITSSADIYFCCKTVDWLFFWTYICLPALW